MSFLTAILGGAGAYNQARQNNALFQNQLEQQRATTGMEEAKWQETARQLLGQRGIDPNTAKWNPQTMQYEGGTPYQMPKGWEQVPTDPQQAMGHWARLMGTFTEQNRPDYADWASKMYTSAATQQTEAQKLAAQFGLEQMKGGYALQAAGMKEQGDWNRAIYSENNQNNRQQMGFQQQDHLKNLEQNFTLYTRSNPTFAEAYNASAKTPTAALDTAQKQVETNRTWLSQQISSMDKANTTLTGKLPGLAGPTANPNMDHFQDLATQITEDLQTHPERMPLYQKAIQQARQDFTTPRLNPKTGKPNPGLSEQQYDVLSRAMNNTVQTANALQTARQAVNVVNTHYNMWSPQSGSNATGNPTPGSGKLNRAQIWDMAVQAGATPEEATKLAAIAIAESGGDPNNKNLHDTNGRGGTQSSWGLFQISDGTHRELPGWNDPQQNLQMALSKMRGAQSYHRDPFSPWGSYNTGVYKQYLPGS